MLSCRMIKRKPSEWVEIIGIEVIDSDGWAKGTWETPIFAEEFLRRCEDSTIRPFSIVKDYEGVAAIYPTVY